MHGEKIAGYRSVEKIRSSATASSNYYYYYHLEKIGIGETTIDDYWLHVPQQLHKDIDE
jgi:hypothetical protein